MEILCVPSAPQYSLPGMFKARESCYGASPGTQLGSRLALDF